MAAQKVFAVFLICLVLAAAMHVTVAHEDFIEDEYKKCLSDCEDKCNKDNKGYTFCEMKCDSDCGAQEFKANLEKLIRT